MMIGFRAIRPCSVGDRQREYSIGKNGLLSNANPVAGDVLKPVPDTRGVPDGHRFGWNLSVRCNKIVTIARRTGNKQVGLRVGAR
jgi:hypothetical protein